MVAYKGDVCAYVNEWGWLTYNGRYWDKEMGEQLVDGLVIDSLQMRSLVAIEHMQFDISKRCACDDGVVVRVRNRLKSIQVKAVSDFDIYPDYLNCANGVINLKTGELLPHNPDWRFTYCVPTEYHPESSYKEWEDFLEDVLYPAALGIPDPDIKVGQMLLFLQMAVGYTLTGHSTEECCFYIQGPTRSGKGTFCGTVQDMMGRKLAKGVDFQSLISDRKDDTQNFDLAGLAGTRMVLASESDKYQRLNSAKLKQMTGRDPIRASFKRKDLFEYDPQFKVWMQSNFPPNVDVYDDAVWGRINLIHFPNSFLNRENTQLKDKLREKAGLEGVLAWAVEGTMIWYEARKASGRGLKAPDWANNLKRQERESRDYVKMFLDTCTDRSIDIDNHDIYEKKQDIYKAYTTFMREELVATPMQLSQFLAALRLSGFVVDKKKYWKGKQKPAILGIKLLPDDEENVQTSWLDQALRKSQPQK